ncbi:MAG: glycogen synthase GlgA [Candidatus Omnitrophica bacterium]|nr:glycogen synthase GlgA [Candidatus Omnitrophota bacterium]
MKIAFFSSEVTPFTKTGGLADVAESLPSALEKEGVELVVVTPRYGAAKTKENPARIGKRTRVYFVEHPGYFSSRQGLYGDRQGDYPDNLDRFSYFCRQGLDHLKKIGFQADVLHCHDWQTALVPVYLKTAYRRDPFFEKSRTVFTIHNMAYQGIFPKEEFSKTGIGAEWFSVNGLEFFGKINLLKGGIQFADTVTTVSPTYAKEIQTKEYGCGLDGVLRTREKHLVGILNGIDADQWNPQTDSEIACNYSVVDLEKKVKNKLALQKSAGLPIGEKIPLVGFVARLAQQKGLELMAGILPRFCAEKGEFILLGTGEDRYHRLFEEFQKECPKRCSIHLKFDASLARQIYAGADFFVIPSVYEPCGLGQMIAMRYGTIPIVRKTGGLADTVRDCDQTPDGNGFVFEEHSSKALYHAIERGIKAFQEKEKWGKLVERAMKCNFSWKASAKEYVRLYERLVGANNYSPLQGMDRKK